MKRLTSTLAPFAATLSVATSAAAFTEDICYPDDGGITECTPLPAVCVPPPNESDACKTAAALEFATTNSTYGDARSTVHVDATYILAQAVGFTATDAYWIAAYSEATDRGSFEPRDEAGNLVGSGTLKTASVPGLQRTDFDTGGVLIHFSAPRNASAPEAVPGIDGLDPDPTDASTEIILAHLRAWAMAGSGPSHPDCAGGLTNASDAGDNATGTTCYSSGGAPATISGAVTLFDGTRFTEPPDAAILDFSVQTGFQIVQDPDGGTVVTSDSFDALVGGDADHVADARLGIYIHAFGDRISHHVCLDDSYLYGPTDGGTAWTADMTSGNCSQGLHSIRHIWETGTDYSMLLPPDRTTIAYLGDAYDELVAFATARDVLASGASSATARTALIDDLTTAESTSGVAARLAALHTVTCAHGLTAFPGEPPCPAASDAGASDGGAGVGDASTGVDAAVGVDASVVTGGEDAGAGATGGGGGKSGGCSVATGDRGALGGVALLTAAALAAWGVRRRRAL